MTTTSRDVAEFLLETYGPMDTWKLQKIVYTVQAIHLADHERPAFDDEIQAWVDGPVARDLFNAHQNQRYVVKIFRGDAGRVAESVRKSAADAWEMLGEETGRALRELSHAEPAWLEAREGLAEDEPSDRPLSLQTMGTSARRYREAAARLPEPTVEQIDAGTSGLLSYLTAALQEAG
jgi:uncharacterized phage-associated protein